MKIYLASSWKNPFYPDVLALLLAWGHEVYDFRNPAPGDNGFSWDAVDRKWQSWGSHEFREGLKHIAACRGFIMDFVAMQDADIFIGVAPFGRSASLEMGWAAGNGKKTILFFPNSSNEMGSELMVHLLDHIAIGIDELREMLDAIKEEENENHE